MATDTRILIFYFRNAKPDDGYRVNPKHVVFLDYYNVVLCIDGLFNCYCIIINIIIIIIVFSMSFFFKLGARGGAVG